MKQHLHIIQSVVPDFTEDELSFQISETSVDSLDLVQIRTLLERYFDHEISDEQWHQQSTLESALQYFHDNKGVGPTKEKANNEIIKHEEDIEIRMPQMSNLALSESWLLKYLGDTHWQLLSIGLGKKSSEFSDLSNNRIYATFLRLNYKLSSLNKFCENEVINFRSKIESFGRGSFVTDVTGLSDKNKIQAKILSTFSKKKCDNSLTSTDEAGRGKITDLETIPSFVNEYKLLKKGSLKEYCAGELNFVINSNLIYECEYQIIPYYDINGVGLLYFAAYPIISDICFSKYFTEATNLHTIFRDTIYFSNCSASEKIIFKLTYLQEEYGHILTCTSLYRKSDHKLLSLIFTAKTY